MDCLVYLHINGQGVCTFPNPEVLGDCLLPGRIDFLSKALQQTCHAIKKSDRSFFASLCSRTLHLRLCDDIPEPVSLTPHEILMRPELLTFPACGEVRRRLFLVGLLEKAFFQLCHGDYHAGRVTHHSLGFLTARRRLYQAAIAEWEPWADTPEAVTWLVVLRHADTLLALERFWSWLAQRQEIAELLQAEDDECRHAVIARVGRVYAQTQVNSTLPLDTLAQCRFLCAVPQTVVVVYAVGPGLQKVIRIGPSSLRDTMCAPAACYARFYQTIRTDIYYDHGRYIKPWLDRLDAYRRDPTLLPYAEQLLSDNPAIVEAAVEALVEKVRRDDPADAALRLLYATIYYWEHADKAACRDLGLRVSKRLEDVVTERPASYPPTRTQRTVIHGDPVVLRVRVIPPARVRRDYIRVRVLWSCNGQRQSDLILLAEETRGHGSALTYTGTFPVRQGWFHYATQVSWDGGQSWSFEDRDPTTQGLIQYVADERGQRVLSCYADAFNLRLTEDHQPVRDSYGATVYGSFDTIAEQLDGIRAEGYTRIYPLGALELGWAGEAGPDPSVFSIWDGRSVRRDLGGWPALLRLRDKAESLDMKIVLCVVSHFARALNDYPYHLPVYIQDGDGRLTRRAGWDGEGSEWLDSFMVNMRDIASVRYLADLAAALTAQGFGLRIDVGHGFDTVFPVAKDTQSTARLLGEVCAPGFEPVDQRGAWQANLALLTLCYQAQKASAQPPVIYAEQWHGNEVRMIQSGATPYNSLIKNLEHLRSGAGVTDEMGLNENLSYLQRLLSQHGGQSLSLFNSHDEESPTSNYQNMIWPVAALLVFSSYGPVAYHISRLPGAEVGSLRERFDQAYLECWKHWVNNRFAHPWVGEEGARRELLARYPMLKGFGAYLRNLFSFADDNPILSRGNLTPIDTGHGRIAAFVRCLGERRFLCVFNFPEAGAQGTQAVTRRFNFALKPSADQDAMGEIRADSLYEIQERYNNVAGRQRHGHKEIWSGAELLYLGFGGVLPPVSFHVYEILPCSLPVDDPRVLADSFLRYFRYGKADRVRHTTIASVFQDACQRSSGGFKRFYALFVTVVTWMRKSRSLGSADLATLLAEIADEDSPARRRVVDFLMRLAVQRPLPGNQAPREAAADILHALPIGTVAMVSPESRFSGSSGGVGLYTTDIADVLSEMGFHVVIVTPLYEQNRSEIRQQFAPQYEGHSCTLRFPAYDEKRESIGMEADADTVNFLRAKLNRLAHGKRSRVEVLYLENAKYFDRPYGGDSAEDKLRRARLFAQGAIEALRSYNYYPSIVQTNEWPTWLVATYLTRKRSYRNDPHFEKTQVLSMMHNPHPAYSVALKEFNARKACYLAKVLDLDPVDDFDVVFRGDRGLDYVIDLTTIMLKTSPFVGTVSKAMRQRILDEPGLFGNARLFQELAAQGRFFGRRNGFNMAARQRYWFGGQKSLLEASRRPALRRLFHRYVNIKQQAKRDLQEDPHIRLIPDDEQHDHVIFGMLHRICRQKGFELLVDWKVRASDAGLVVVHDPNDMGGPTVLEHFLASDPRIQFVICGRVEDSFDARRFHLHLDRIAGHPDFQGRLAYYPEGNLPPSLYRNLYLGCQFFVMPSGGDIGEPCGIGQQEAHAGGTPVIAHHQDGLKITVCDRDFGDEGPGSNGIKFDGFTGDCLLTALEDAVEIYYQGRRRYYRDTDGQPRPLRYEDLSFNAFCTDHRWLRMLRDYVTMYAHMLGVALPDHLEAVQLIVAIDHPSQKTPGDAVLKRGLTLTEAQAALAQASNCPIVSVRHTAMRAIQQLTSGNTVKKKRKISHEPVRG